jgi:hypothetical protein
MANAYVRFWLAIYEVEGKDPHIAIATSAAALLKVFIYINKIYNTYLYYKCILP